MRIQFLATIILSSMLATMSLAAENQPDPASTQVAVCNATGSETEQVTSSKQEREATGGQSGRSEQEKQQDRGADYENQVEMRS